MNIVLLGGNAVINKEWVDDIASQVGDMFEQAIVQNFYHWQDGGKDIDLDKEVSQLAEIVKDWKEYMVLAKSAGCLVVLKALNEGKISPQKILFFGFPYEWSKEKGWETDKYLNELKTPTFFIQKSEDWAMRYEDLEKLVEEKVSAPHKLLLYHRESEPDDIHHYADISYIKSLMKEWINEG